MIRAAQATSPRRTCANFTSFKKSPATATTLWVPPAATARGSVRPCRRCPEVDPLAPDDRSALRHERLHDGGLRLQSDKAPFVSSLKGKNGSVTGNAPCPGAPHEERIGGSTRDRKTGHRPTETGTFHDSRGNTAAAGGRAVVLPRGCHHAKDAHGRLGMQSSAVKLLQPLSQ